MANYSKNTLEKNILTLEERLVEIVNTSYCILCSKIVSKCINIPNEASFQLQFGVILKQVGQLYEFEEKDKFSIQLEDVQTINATQKSKNGKARCDIMLSLKNGNNYEAAVAIELKHFKKFDGETITDNRFKILCDIENLESYKKINHKMICYEILYTNNPNYANPDSSSYIKIGNGVTLNAGEHISNERIVKLEKAYTLKWDIYKNNNCFLKIEV